MYEAELDLLVPKSFLFRSTADPLACVDFFESGEENVYLLSDQGMYLGLACQRQNFRLGWNGHDCKAQFSPMSPAVFDMPINEKNLPQLSKAVDVALTANPGAKEVPVVSGGGYCCCSEDKKTETTNSKTITMEKIWRFSPVFSGKADFYRVTEKYTLV